jgi:predicted transglutaminase-like cysteine proteinase
MSTSIWALELSRTLLDYIDNRFGSSATQRLIDWQTLANSNLDRQAIEKLNDVNAFFNQATFISDQKHWGSEDYWATPVELLATNGGDCEDYSIAKYFTLKEMGIPEEKLKITYVKALKLNQAHMVLAYYEQPDSEPLILDNLIAEIKPSSQRDDLLPVYSFNGEGLWLSRFKGNKQKRIGGPERLDNWLDMMTRQNKLIK